MGKILNPIIRLFRFHKLKMLTVILVAVLFFIALFPNDDLSDWVSAQVARGTGLYMEFDELGFTILPAPGVQAAKVAVEAPGLPAIRTEELDASLSLTDILGAKLGFDVDASGLFKGALALDYAQGEKLASGDRVNNIALKASTISLDDLFDFLRKANIAPMKLQGAANLDTALRVDHTFSEQPSGTLTLNVPNLVMPSQTLMVVMNGPRVPLPLPEMAFGRVALNTRLNNGVLEITDLNMTGNNNDISGKARGTIQLQLAKGPGGVYPMPGEVDLALDLVFSKDFVARDRTIPTTIETMSMGRIKGVPVDRGTRYGFRLKASAQSGQFSFEPLSEKL